jgi:uncharacterized membrane protein
MEEAKHLKSQTDIQLERLLFFSDGVFAISITLMVIEIKVPALAIKTDHSLMEYLSETLLKFFGFIISFAIVGQYWVVHHRIFGYVKKYTNKLLWLNLLFLFSVVILPFSSGLLGEYSSELDMKIPYLVYVLGIFLVSTMNVILWKYVSNPKHTILTHSLSKDRIRLGVYRSLTIPFVFLISLLFSFKFPLFSRFIPILIPIILHYGLKGLEKKANQKEK